MIFCSSGDGLGVLNEIVGIQMKRIECLKHESRACWQCAVFFPTNLNAKNQIAPCFALNKNHLPRC